MISDPILQALMALCSHPKYVVDCGACEYRSTACCEHLARLAESALEGL